MKRPNRYFPLALLTFVCLSCTDPTKKSDLTAAMPIYKDVPYLQDYTIKFDLKTKIHPYPKFLWIEMGSSRWYPPKVFYAHMMAGFFTPESLLRTKPTAP